MKTLIALLLLLAPIARAADPAPAEDARMQWWREARFGLFIHWGLYAVPAGEWNGETGHGEWIMNTAHIPVERYEKFKDQFNPVKFDADRWVALARDAGMRYVVITSKHHDGFCLFDSKHTDYDVMATPFHRDILKELSAACAKGGLRMCFYHSIMDWHHPDYLPRREWETRSAEGAQFPRYVDHLHAQIEELLTNYGPIGVMWFDGEWESTWNHPLGKALYDECRKLQPDVIVNNRVDVGRSGMAGMTKDASYCGDFGTPEQEIPADGLPGVDWETCMTMNDHWGFNAHDQDFKSGRDLVRKLCDIASKGGNFLLNVGPRADGTFPDACVERLEYIGRWMKTNGEAIHGTTASPLGAWAPGRITSKPVEKRGTRLYLCVFDWPQDGVLRLPNLGTDPMSAQLLADPQAALKTSRDGDAVVVHVPKQAPDPDVSVVALDFAGTAVVFAPPAIEAWGDRFVTSVAPVVRAAKDLEVRFTRDGSAPTAQSESSDGKPIELSATTTLKAASFHDGRRVSEVVARTFEKVFPRRAEKITLLTPGIERRLVRGEFARCADFRSREPEVTETVKAFDLAGLEGQEDFGLRFEALVSIPADDVYRLVLESDDGATLSVDGETLIDLDGLHSLEEKEGQTALQQGLHRVKLEYFNRTGKSALRLRIARASGGELEEPDARFH